MSWAERQATNKNPVMEKVKWTPNITCNPRVRVRVRVYKWTPNISSNPRVRVRVMSQADLPQTGGPLGRPACSTLSPPPNVDKIQTGS
jgi:hypothetical protein